MNNDKNTVGLTYCNGTEFLHEYVTDSEALGEFSTLLPALVEPADGETAQLVHLRQVVVNMVRPNGRTMKLDSGVFECEHKGLDA